MFMTLSFPDLQDVLDWRAIPRITACLLWILLHQRASVERIEDRFKKIKLQLLNVVRNLHVDLLINHLVILDGLYALRCGVECSRSSTTNMVYDSNVVAGVQCLFIV